MRKYNRLSFEERVKIEIYFNLGWSLVRIADKLIRNKSTISRELTRFPFSYNADKAQKEATRKSHIHNYRRRLDYNDPLFNLIFRFLKKRWSPQQISTYLKKKYVGKQKMQISG